jgi:hypothetical protein
MAEAFGRWAAEICKLADKEAPPEECISLACCSSQPVESWIEKGLFNFTRMSDEHGLDLTQWPRLSISPDQGSDGDPSLTSLHNS